MILQKFSSFCHFLMFMLSGQFGVHVVILDCGLWEEIGAAG